MRGEWKKAGEKKRRAKEMNELKNEGRKERR